jgi:hypothetical protein
MKEITLQDGTVVRVRPVPAYATTQAVMQFPDPEMPVVKIKTLAGEESKLASPGTPEWMEYQKEMRAVQLKRVNASRALDYDFGVIDWLLPEDAKEDGFYTSEPPEDWQFPEALLRHGVQPFGAKRIDYIAFELLAHPADHDAFFDITNEAAPLTEAEVEAALQSFPVEVARRIIAATEEQWDND